MNCHRVLTRDVYKRQSIDKAAEYIVKFLPGSSKNEAVAGIINDTNCDRVFFEDESVIFRYYGRGYNETIINEMRENGYGV